MYSRETLSIAIWQPPEEESHSTPYETEHTHLKVTEEDSSLLGCYMLTGK